MGEVSGASQASSAERPTLTAYQRLRRLEQLEREHVRLMRGWSSPANIAYAISRGAEYSERYGCYIVRRAR